MTLQPTRHGNTRIFPASLDPHAVDVVTRLTNAGFETYLVGGCVRDLLLGHIPKDFDVSTAARPRQIRRVFRNCRVIGRRFKLAHVHFGDKIIEVATFRQKPPADDAQKSSGEGDDDADASDLLIVRDNVFGTAEEDSVRRDFTINALLYDVASNEVIDYVGGVEDVENKILRTIGEPAIRLAEDPVRMLRAIKFTSRLGLTLEPELDKALHDCAELIDRSSPARVIEEIFKLLSCGKSECSQAMLLDYGLLQRLLPELSDYWSEHRDELVALGRALDHVDAGQRRVSNAFLLAVLFHDPFRALCAEQEDVDPMVVAADLIGPAALRTSIPRRDVAHMKHMLVNQLRLERNRRGRRFRMNDFLARPSTHEAIDLLYVRSLAGSVEPEQHAEWAHRMALQLGDADRPEESDEPPSEGRPRRRRRRRSRGGRGRSGRSRRSDSSASETDESDPPQDSPAQETNGSASRDAAAEPAETSALKEAVPAVKAPAQSRPATGFKGLVRSLFRKVIGSESDPAEEAPVEAPRRQPVARPITTPAAEGDDADTSSPAEQPAADVEGGEDGTDKPRRPRHRRRRRRSSGKSATTSEAGSTEESDSKSEATADSEASESSSPPKRSRRSRGGRGGRQSGGGQRSSAPSSGGGSSGSKSRRSHGGSDRAANRTERPPRDDLEVESPSGEKESNPGQRHPEDVEDTFDW
jgi:poly(A) polymerase